MNDEHFFQFNLTYDKSQLVDLFEQYIYDYPAEQNLKSPFRSISDVVDLSDCPAVATILDSIPIIPNRPQYYQLTNITKNVHPHTNPGNNGTIFFPVSGEVKISFYSWEAPLDERDRPLLSPFPERRPQFSPEEKKALEDSMFHTVTVDRPIAINGLKVHSYTPVSLEPPLVFAIKIPLDVDWQDLINNHIRYE